MKFLKRFFKEMHVGDSFVMENSMFRLLCIRAAMDNKQCLCKYVYACARKYFLSMCMCM